MTEEKDSLCVCQITLPCLPSYNLRTLPDVQHHKSQHLGFKSGQRKVKNTIPRNGGAKAIDISSNEYEALCKFQLKDLMYEGHPRSKEPVYLPKFVKEPDLAMKFMAYFIDGDETKPDVLCHLRHVFITYFPYDGTMSIYEPEEDNSGLMQGKLLRRMKVPRDGKAGHYDWSDLNVGVDLKIFGRVYHIYDAEKATKDYMELEGTKVNQPEEPPGYRNSSDGVPCRNIRTRRQDTNVYKFYQYDKMVLRFYALWDDRVNLFGEIRPHIIYYFLSDDTIQVQEVQLPNSGRDSCSVMLKRQRITKKVPVLDVAGKDVDEDSYFHPQDFAIGNTVNIYNRKFLVYDCDKFTREFMLSKFGLTMSEPIDYKEEKKEVGSVNKDSNRQAQVKKLISYLEDQHKVLRYRLETETVLPQVPQRTVLLLYYLADDTACLKEPGAKSDVGKTFHKRGALRKFHPDSTSLTPVYDGIYTPQDFSPGALVQVGNHRLHITDADLRVVKYYKKHLSRHGEEIYSQWKEHFLQKGWTEEELEQEMSKDNVGDTSTPTDTVSEYARSFKNQVREYY